MLPYLILGIALLAGLLLTGRWYASAHPRTVIKVLKWTLVGLVFLIAAFFLISGRLGWAMATLPALIPWFFRLRSVARLAKTFSRMSQTTKGSASGQISEVETRYLRMILEHDTGNMTGEVLAGDYAGRRVEEMACEQLISLLKVCRQDEKESARLIEAYLDREFANWREEAKNHDSSGPFPGGNMEREEALQVLGLQEGVSEYDIREAHRRLIAGMHPDHGGSDYLAAQINHAKDVLLE